MAGGRCLTGLSMPKTAQPKGKYEAAACVKLVEWRVIVIVVGAMGAIVS